MSTAEVVWEEHIRGSEFFWTQHTAVFGCEDERTCGIPVLPRNECVGGQLCLSCGAAFHAAHQCCVAVRKYVVQVYESGPLIVCFRYELISRHVARHSFIFTLTRAFFVSINGTSYPNLVVPADIHICGSRSRFAEPGTSTGLGDVNPDAAEITNVVIGNVGGSGTYTEVMSMAPGENMECTDTAAACVKEVCLFDGPEVGPPAALVMQYQYDLII